MSVLGIDSLADTRLWKRLSVGFAATEQRDIASDLATKVRDACRTASERIKPFAYFHPEFTVHDRDHLLRVTELMAIVLGDDLEKLNAIEIALLILSAFFHDQGMVPDADEWVDIQESSEFRLSVQRWEIDHPNMRELRRQLDDPRFTPQEKQELAAKLQQHLDAHRTDFLRSTHGERAEQLVHRLYAAGNDLVVANTSLAQLLGRLCVSHVMPAARLTDENGFRLDASVGHFKINIRFLALILRLADILDFDRDRTPTALLRTISFSSPVSLLEWSKHRSVEGWEISAKRIRFTLACEHPAYQKAAYDFMDAIDYELREAHRIVDDFPRDTPTHYRLTLPRHVERDRIGPRNNAYRYADLEFGLSRDEVVKLLMTDKLYRTASLFVREPIQNSLDALRHRVATHGKGHPDWEGGSVKLEHFIDVNGHQVVRCTDNGIGMDEPIVRNFLTNAGRSYYRSPEFAQQRIAFRANGVDFDPCAQFGIGFMSCFMFGDRIAIKTRRDYGPDRGYGEPLEIDINGLGGLLVIRDGRSDQPVGTSVEITGPRKPAFLDEWADDVMLCAVARGYALATEFPIIAETNIEEIADRVEIPTKPAYRKTRLEEQGLKNIEVIEYDLRNTDSRLGGTIRIGLLKDDHGIPCIKNSEAAFEVKEKGKEHHLMLTVGDKSEQYYGTFRESATCMDGILVCGQPGREDDGHEVAYRLGFGGNPLQLGDPFVVDIRGELKPMLTPSRTPPDRTWRREPTWTRVSDLLRLAHAKAWVPVLHATTSGLSHEDFWRLSMMHRAPVHLMPEKDLWAYAHVSTIESEENSEANWVALAGLGQVEADFEGDEGNRNLVFRNNEGKKIAFGTNVRRWLAAGYGDTETKLAQLLLRFAEIDIIAGKPAISIVRPNSGDIHESDLGMDDGRLSFVPAVIYAGEAKNLLSIQASFRSANRQHPLVQFVQGFQHADYRDCSDFQHFCASAVWTFVDDKCLSALATRSERGRQFRSLGTVFKALDWGRHDKSLAPPYAVWTRDSGIIKIEPEDFERWAKLPPDR